MGLRVGLALPLFAQMLISVILSCGRPTKAQSREPRPPAVRKARTPGLVSPQPRLLQPRWTPHLASRQSGSAGSSPFRSGETPKLGCAGPNPWRAISPADSPHTKHECKNVKVAGVGVRTEGVRVDRTVEAARSHDLCL